MHCFRTAEVYFGSLIDSFDILAIFEHCLFEEQLGTLTSKCNNNYNCIAASSNENPPILPGKAAYKKSVIKNSKKRCFTVENLT